MAESRGAKLGESNPEVVRVTARRQELTAKNVPALQELFGLERLPLAETYCEVELRGVPTVFVNALRRTVMDEMPGYCLRVPDTVTGTVGFDADKTTDKFMLPQFVNQRVSLLPLPPGLSAEVLDKLRLRLDVTNGEARPINVYAGDFKVVAGGELVRGRALFNPNFKIGFLQPGKRLVLENVRLATGTGRFDAAFQVARRGAYRHLDLPQHTADQMRLPPDRAAALALPQTLDSRAVIPDLSGYKVSCMVANPRHHVLSFIVPASTAASDAVAVLADACRNLRDRLRSLLPALAEHESREGLTGSSGAHFMARDAGEGLELGRLQVPGETDTLGALLARVIHDLVPGVSFATYECGTTAGVTGMVLTVRHSAAGALVADAVHHAVEMTETVAKQLSTAKIGAFPPDFALRG